MPQVRTRSLAVTADGANNQTTWLSAKEGILATIYGTFVGTATLQRRDSAGNISDVTDNAGTAITFTAPRTFSYDCLGVHGDYRLNCKSGAYTSGTLNMQLEGR